MERIRGGPPRRASAAPFHVSRSAPVLSLGFLVQRTARTAVFRVPGLSKALLFAFSIYGLHSAKPCRRHWGYGHADLLFLPSRRDAVPTLPVHPVQQSAVALVRHYHALATAGPEMSPPSAGDVAAGDDLRQSRDPGLGLDSPGVSKKASGWSWTGLGRQCQGSV